MDPDLLRAKALMRRRLRTIRSQLCADRDQASAAAAALAPLTRWADPAVVAGYQPMADEIDPWPLLRRLAGAGARVALPVVVARGAPLIFRLASPDGALRADAAGIPAPPPTAPQVVPDLIIAPLLAFDRAGRRLGQGGGFYDRTLAGLRASGKVFVIGLAFAAQEVGEVPAGPGDERLNAILTEKAYTEI